MQSWLARESIVPHVRKYLQIIVGVSVNASTWFNGSVPDVTPFATGPYGGNPGTTDWQAVRDSKASVFQAIFRAL